MKALRKLKAKPTPKRSPRGFTKRREAFIEQYLIDRNGTQAATRAGYSPRTANEQAARLLAIASVREEIERRLSVMSASAGIDAQWLLDRLAEEAKADANDLYDNAGNFKPISEWPLIWRQGLVAGIDMGEVTVDGKTERRPVKIKLSDRAKRLELVGKHIAVQAFKERTEFNIPPGTAEEIGKGIAEGMSAKQAAEKYREKLG